MIVTLQFHLNEDVTPEIFARQITRACARGGAIRMGEKVQGGNTIFEYIGDKEIDLFGKGDTIQVPHLNIYSV